MRKPILPAVVAAFYLGVGGIGTAAADISSGPTFPRPGENFLLWCNGQGGRTQESPIPGVQRCCLPGGDCIECDGTGLGECRTDDDNPFGASTGTRAPSAGQSQPATSAPLLQLQR